MKPELRLDLSQFESKFQKLLKEYSAGNKIMYSLAEKQIATEIGLRLRRKRVVKNVRDFLLKRKTEIHYPKAQVEKNLENCSRSIINIREFLENKLAKVGVSTNDSNLVLLIDFALSGILQFLDFDECFDVNHKYSKEYIDALSKIRKHLLLVVENMDLVAGITDSYGPLSNLVTNFSLDKNQASISEDSLAHIGNKGENTLWGFEEPISKYAKKSNHKIGFGWIGTVTQLSTLFDELLSEHVISSSTDKSLFERIFSNSVISTEDKIIWLLKDVHLAYLFEELIEFNLIPHFTQYNSKNKNHSYFVSNDKTQSRFDNLKGAKQSYLNNKKSVPTDADIIDRILNKVMQSQ